MKRIAFLIFSMFFMLVPMASAANWVQFEIKELDGSSDLSTDYFDADSVMCQVDANGDLERIYYWEKRVYPSTTDSKIDYQIGFVRYDKADYRGYDALMYSHFATGSALFQHPVEWTDRGKTDGDKAVETKKAEQVMVKEIERGKAGMHLHRIRTPLSLLEIELPDNLIK